MKIAVFVLIFLGEALSIAAEVIAAKTQQKDGVFIRPFLYASGAMVLAGVLLIGGYMLGIRAFRDIWIIGVISLGTIVLTEPLVNYLVFRELPSLGPTIGMGLGIAAIASATLIK